ncbi:MAG: DUF2058 family protein [Thiothrix sp.]
MANSLLDQLLKAGLVTEEQAEKASQPKPSNSRQAPRRGHTSHTTKRASPPPKPQQNKEVKAPRPAKKEKSDLAQFYEARNQAEQKERREEEQRRRERAERRKQVRAQVDALVSANLQNVDDAEIRYNFVVGENIKYLYVTEQQQQDLADGKLAITFLAGKRCLITAETAQQILALDPDKLIVINTAVTEAES